MSNKKKKKMFENSNSFRNGKLTRTKVNFVPYDQEKGILGEYRGVFGHIGAYWGIWREHLGILECIGAYSIRV